MPETVPDRPGAIRAVANWVLRILPIAALLGLLAWGATTIVRLRENPVCDVVHPGDEPTDAQDPGKVRCK